MAFDRDALFQDLPGTSRRDLPGDPAPFFRTARLGGARLASAPGALRALRCAAWRCPCSTRSYCWDSILLLMRASHNLRLRLRSAPPVKPGVHERPALDGQRSASLLSGALPPASTSCMLRTAGGYGRQGLTAIRRAAVTAEVVLRATRDEPGCPAKTLGRAE